MAGNEAARVKDFAVAEARYTKALGMKVEGMDHLLYANRSGVRLRAGNVEGALSDALEAIRHSPLDFTTV